LAEGVKLTSNILRPASAIDRRQTANAQIFWHVALVGDGAYNAQSLVEGIKVLAARACDAGFQTTEYILNLAVAELWKDIEKEKKDAKE
jgi:hypothetical protein